MTHAAHARPLQLDPADERPDSALSARWLSGTLFVGGLAGTVLIPLAFLILVALSALVSLAIHAVVDVLTDESDEELLLEEEDVIEARFVRLGRDFEDELPNRVVPVLATAPPPPSEVPTEEQPPEEQVEPVEEPPPNAVEDLIARLDDRAELFEELAERRELEGSAEGIEEGTETEGSEGDIYRGRLREFFKRGWTIPTTLSSEEVRTLQAVVTVRVGQNLEIVSFEIRRSSGNVVFDESVIQQLTRLRASDQHLPPPPEAMAASIIGHAVVTQFSGSDAR